MLPLTIKKRDYYMTDIIDVTPEVVTAPAQDGPLITVQDLFTVVKLLEDMANKNLWGGQSRLSETEIAHVKPAFDKIVLFLAEYERQMNAASPQQSVLESETQLLDLGDDAGEVAAPIAKIAPKKAAKPAKVEAPVKKVAKRK